MINGNEHIMDAQEPIIGDSESEPMLGHPPVLTSGDQIATSNQKPGPDQDQAKTTKPKPQDRRKTSDKMGRQDVLTIKTVAAALEAAHGVKTVAAAALGVSYTAFWKFLKKNMTEDQASVDKPPTLKVIRADLHERNKTRIVMRDKYLSDSASTGPAGMENQKHPPGTPDHSATAPPSPSPQITAEVVSNICRFMLDNETGLIPACRTLGYKATAVHYFMSKKGNETIREEYLAIRFALVDMAVDQMDEVAEDCDPVNYNAQRVRLSAMQWKASALRPDLYGGVKKNDAFIAPGSEKKLTDEELDRRIRGTLAKLDALEGREPKPRESTAKTEAPADAVDSGFDAVRGLPVPRISVGEGSENLN